MTRIKHVNLAFIFLLLSVSTNMVLASQAFDANESAIVAWSEAHTEDAVELLEKLVNINSGSLNKQGVKDVGEVLRSELDALGFETRWIEQPV